MSFALQSYTPTVLPIDYDWLLAREGCEPESGFSVANWLAFDRICIARHSATDAAFNQPDTVSYALGPATPGGSAPHRHLWTAWAHRSGVRIGKVGVVTDPANNGSGDASSLYPTTSPDKVSHAFDGAGLLHLAIQKTAGTVEIKWYTDALGASDSKAFDGVSALLFYSGLLDAGSPADSRVLCFYLKPGASRKIYARTSADGFESETLAMPDLRADPRRLISTFPKGRRQYLLFSDAQGRDVTLRSPEYAAKCGPEASSLAAAFESGAVRNQAVNADAGPDDSTLSLLFASGYVFDAIADPASQPDAEASTLSAEFDSGEILKP